MIYLILALALGLRLLSLNQSFWLDEATSANVASLSLNSIVNVFAPGDFHPPLYYLLLHFWVYLFGPGEVAIRLLSVLAGLGTVYTLYLIGKELVGKRLGGIAALLLGTSGLHIYYSQEARMYSLATLFISLTFLFFVKILKKGRVGEWLLFSLFLTLSVFTDYLPGLIIPGFWLFAWRQKLKPIWWKKLCASHIILVGMGFLWLPYFLKQLSAGLSVRSQSPFWWQILGQANFKELILIPTKFIFGRINMEINPVQILIVIGTFLVFGFLLLLSLKSWEKSKSAWFWFVTPLFLAVAVSFWLPTVSYFRFLFVLPAFYLLVAIGSLKMPKIVGTYIVGVLMIFNLITSSFYLFDSKNQREDWRGLVSFIQKESLGKESAVVFAANSQQEAYRYYDKGAKITPSEELDASYEELWLMRYVQEIFDPKDTVRLKIEELGYQKEHEYNFNGVVVWKYKK